MNDFDDRTQLWNYRNNRVPDSDRHPYGREPSSARAYDLYGEDEYGGRSNDRERPYNSNDRYSQYRNQRDRATAGRDYHGQVYGQHYGEFGSGRSYGSSGSYGGRSDYNAPSRDYDVNRGGAADYRSDQPFSSTPIWPSELGFPPISGGTRRSQTARRDGYRHPDEDQSDRGFLERAGDEFMSWFGDRDAIRRREHDHRGRGPKAYVRSDERIREDVNDRLTDDNWIDASNIDVTVSEGEVTLSGTVSDRHSKRRAEDVTDGITGVKHVQNNLRYSGTTSASPSTID